MKKDIYNVSLTVIDPWSVHEVEEISELTKAKKITVIENLVPEHYWHVEIEWKNEKKYNIGKKLIQEYLENKCKHSNSKE